MSRYSRPYTGNKRIFRNMDDIYSEYRNTLLNKGPYRAYFSSRASYGEPRKFSKSEYTSEPNNMTKGERVHKEQHNEIRPNKTDETKTEISKENQKIESSQKTETKTSQKIEQQNETEDELSYEKIGLPYEKTLEQTGIMRNRQSQYDRAETRLGI